MLFIEVNFLRFVSIFIGQGSLAIFFILISYQLLERSQSSENIILSLFYILESSSFVLNIIFFFVRSNPVTTILCFIAIYLMTFSPILLLSFLYFLYPIGNKYCYHKISIIVYGIFLFILLIIPGSFEISENTEWRPEISWFFLISLYILFTGFIFIPFIIRMEKISGKFKDYNLKKRWIYFKLGFYGIMMSFYGLILYSKWRNPIFQVIYPLLTFLLIPAGYLLYLGIAKRMDF